MKVKLSEEEKRIRRAEHKRRWCEANKESIAKQSRRYHEDNREKILKRQREWQAANPNYKAMRALREFERLHPPVNSMFKVFQTIKDPDCVRVIPDKDREHVDVISHMVKGEFARVTSMTAKDFNYLRMLEHNVDKFTPHTGNGVFVRIEKILAARSQPS